MDDAPDWGTRDSDTRTRRTRRALWTAYDWVGARSPWVCGAVCALQALVLVYAAVRAAPALALLSLGNVMWLLPMSRRHYSRFRWDALDSVACFTPVPIVVGFACALWASDRLPPAAFALVPVVVAALAFWCARTARGGARRAHEVARQHVYQAVRWTVPRVPMEPITTTTSTTFDERWDEAEAASQERWWGCVDEWLRVPGLTVERKALLANAGLSPDSALEESVAALTDDDLRAMTALREMNNRDADAF